MDLQIKMPTRILKKPWFATGRRCDGMVFECDNGQTYNGKSLAALFGMRWSSFARRLAKEGWDGERVLRPKARKKGRYKEVEVVDAALSDIDVSRLGCRERAQKLERIKGPTSYEAALWG